MREVSVYIVVKSLKKLDYNSNALLFNKHLKFSIYKIIKIFMEELKFPGEVNGKALANVIEETGKELGHVTQREKEEASIRITSKQYFKKGLVDKLFDALEWLLPCDGPFLYLGFEAQIDPTKKYSAIDLQVFEHRASAAGNGNYYLGSYESGLKYRPSIHKFVQGIMGRVGRLPLWY